MKKTGNTILYKEVTDKIGDKLGPSFAPDRSWLDSSEKKHAQTQERLENELSGYKTQLIKESIRVGHNELGDFHYERGDLNTALKCYVRTRDYCSDPKHIIQMCLNVIKVSLELGNYSHVSNYVSKAEQTGNQDNLTASKVRVCSGLSFLDSRKYKLAARKFLEISPELGANYNEVIAPADVALYGGLLALSSFDRSELKSKLLGNQTFKNYLELVPDLRELISDFYNSRYASCLSYLEKLRPHLELDIFLAGHVNSLYEKIRSKAIIQYFSPYVSVNLNVMAEAFKTSVSGLEKELSRLIMEGSISARIDSHGKVLYARTIDQRSATFDKALQMGEEYQRNTKAMLLRMNCVRNEFYVKPRMGDDEPAAKRT
jgi:COP9 signalosome complex subunit 1